MVLAGEMIISTLYLTKPNLKHFHKLPDDHIARWVWDGILKLWFVCLQSLDSEVTISLLEETLNLQACSIVIGLVWWLYSTEYSGPRDRDFGSYSQNGSYVKEQRGIEQRESSPIQHSHWWMSPVCSFIDNAQTKFLIVCEEMGPSWVHPKSKLCHCNLHPSPVSFLEWTVLIHARVNSWSISLEICSFAWKENRRKWWSNGNLNKL